MMKRINVDRVYNETFYQFPKAFITDPKYKDMNDGSKIVYMLLKARSEYAMIRKQYDEKGDIYFTFSNKELANLTNYSERKVTSCKKELIDRNLLEQVQLGSNQKPRLYLGELDVDGVYEKPISSLTNSGVAKFASQNSTKSIENSAVSQNCNVQLLEGHGVAKFATPFGSEKTGENVDKSTLVENEISQTFSKSLEGHGIAKSATNIIYNNKLSDTSDTLIDTSKEQFMQIYSKSFLSKDLLLEIYVFKQDDKDGSELINRIYQSKRQVEKEIQVFIQSGIFKISGENYQEPLLNLFRRFIGQEKIRRSTEKNIIQHRLGYWYRLCENFWRACVRWENVEGKNCVLYGNGIPNVDEILDLEIQMREAQKSLNRKEFLKWMNGISIKESIIESSLFDFVN